MMTETWWPSMPEPARILWHFSMGRSLFASPVTYMVNGKQYVSIAAESDIFTFGLME